MFKVCGFTATVLQEKQFMCGFCMSHEELYSLYYGSPKLDTIFLKSIFYHSIKHHLTLYAFSCIGLIYSETSLFPLSTTHRPVILTPFLSFSLSLTCDQVWPCMASSNRKCIMDVTLLSISTTVSHTPLFQVIMNVRASKKKMDQRG